MAPRKPLPNPTKLKLKPVLKATPKPLAAMPAIQQDHTHGSCCSHGAPQYSLCNALCCLTTCCPLAKMLVTRSFWAASVVAFLVIFATDWFLHTKFLQPEYAASSSLWRYEGEIRHSLIFITQAFTALAYAAIIIGLGYSRRWLGSMSSGLLAGAPAAICAMNSYIMLPFASPYIPTVWAIASLLQGALTGLAICAALRLSRAPAAETNPDTCCPPKPTLH